MPVNVLDISKFKNDLGLALKISFEDEARLTRTWRESRKMENTYVRL
jgi:hypothetical protein